jgi:hypothetical protein
MMGLVEEPEKPSLQERLTVWLKLDFTLKTAADVFFKSRRK